MRLVLAVLAIAVLAVAGFYGAVLLASESGEVVTLRTRAAEGGTHATRLWIVDHAGAEWVRTGHPGKGWFQRTLAPPIVELERGGRTSTRVAVAVADPAVAEAVAGEFLSKYGIADRVVALSGDAARRIPVRLDPAPP